MQIYLQNSKKNAGQKPRAENEKKQSLADLDGGIDLADEAFEDITRAEFIEFDIGVGIGFGVCNHVLNRLCPANRGRELL